MKKTGLGSWFLPLQIQMGFEIFQTSFHFNQCSIPSHILSRILRNIKGSVARSGWYQYRPSSVEKRNLQSLARNGMLRSDLARYVSSLNGRDLYRQQEQKRHIGSVARSGWLPAFRPVRSGRFSRSGRARSQTVGS